MKTMARAQPGRWMLALILLALASLAMVLGVFGAVVGWFGQLFLMSLLVPLVLLVVDYRNGLIVLAMLLPFANSPVIPRVGPLNVFNLMLAGVCGMYLLRATLMFMLQKGVTLPASRQLLLFYVLPVTLSIVIGSFHFNEAPRWLFAINGMEGYSLKDYVISQYIKNMLLVFTACIIGAAVVEYGKGLRFAVALVVAACLFVAAAFALIVVTGTSFEALKDQRSFLIALGRHNNEAGVLLTTALGPALFMHAKVTSRAAKTALLVAVGTIITGIVITFSRGAFLGMMVILLVYVIHFRRAATALLLVAGLVVVAAALAPEALYERLATGLDSSEAATASVAADPLTAGRMYTWAHLLPEILKSPVWGRGQVSTQWSDYVRDYGFSATHPHNLYLEILLDMGLLGAIVMFFFYRYVWRLFRSLGSDERLQPSMRGFFIGAWAGLLSMFVYGMSNGHYYPAPEQAFFWIAVGLALGYSHRLGPAEEVLYPVPSAPRTKPLVPPDRVLAPRPVGLPARWCLWARCKGYE